MVMLMDMIKIMGIKNNYAPIIFERLVNSGGLFLFFIVIITKIFSLYPAIGTCGVFVASHSCALCY